MQRVLENILIVLTIISGFITMTERLFLGLAMVVAAVLFFLWTRRAGIYLLIMNNAYSRRGSLVEALGWFRRAWLTRRLKTQEQIHFFYLLLKAEMWEEAAEILPLIRSGIKAGVKQEKNLLRQLSVYETLLLWKQGRLAEAVQTLLNLHEKGYRTAALYEILVWALLEQGDSHRALALGQEARDYDGRNPVILDNLGQAWLAAGKTDEALECYQSVLDRNPGFPEFWWGYARALLASGQESQAQEAWTKAQELPFHGLSTITRDSLLAWGQKQGWEAGAP